VVGSTPELEDEAITDWLGRYGDQGFSFTDGVSFAVMQERTSGKR
jgi:predicted nucleic acid-binding protein